MAERFSRATLSIWSDTHRAEDITAVLGLRPSNLWEKGDANVGVVTGRTYRSRHAAAWHYDPDYSLLDPSDDSGFAALRVLVADLAPRAAALASLRPHYQTYIRWSGDSGSEQGNFTMGADLVVALGLLGCEFWGTLHNDEGEGSTEPDPD